jgi:hypothetical protein
VCENRTLRRVFSPERVEVTGEWRELHNEELNDLYSSLNIVWVIKSRRMRWAGNVARMGEGKDVYRVVVGKPVGTRPLWRSKVVKVTLVQALRLCTGRTVHRGSRGIALPFHDHGTRRAEGSASRPGLSLPRERPGTDCTGGWVGPRTGLDRCGKSRPHRNSIPGSFSLSLYGLSYPAYSIEWDQRLFNWG